MQKNDAIKKKYASKLGRGEEYGASGRGAFYAFAYAYAPLCSSGAALREVLCAVQRSLRLAHRETWARAYTHTIETAVTYIHCNKLRCTYVQRAPHVTHVLAYATGSLRLFRSSSPLLIFPLFPPRPILFIFSLLLSRSHSYIYTHTHTGTNTRTYIPRFSLSASLCALLFVGQRLYPTPPLECAHSSSQIYTPKCTHETTKSACGCWPRARCTFCLRGNLRLLCVVRARSRLEFYTLFSDLLRRAFRYTELNKGNRKTAIARSLCAFRKVEMLRRALL